MNTVKDADRARDSSRMASAAQLAHYTRLTYAMITSLHKFTRSHHASRKHVPAGQISQGAKAHVAQAPMPPPGLLHRCPLCVCSGRVVGCINKIQSHPEGACEKHPATMQNLHAVGATRVGGRVKLHRETCIDRRRHREQRPGKLGHMQHFPEHNLTVWPPK